MHTAAPPGLPCSYTEDVLAAFADGVTFHVRPDRSRWRPFPSLSGGQQALATLALCFALQAAFPSPFYFFVRMGRARRAICLCVWHWEP